MSGGDNENDEAKERRDDGDDEASNAADENNWRCLGLEPVNMVGWPTQESKNKSANIVHVDWRYLV